MFDFHDLLGPDRVLAGIRVANKKQLLGLLADAAAPACALPAARIADLATERERLGSTGFGGGVAIPHAKADGLHRVVGVFAQLANPVDFDALDRRPVDLAFLLLSPTQAGAEHLKALARVSRMFRDEAFTAKLRGVTGADAMYALLAGDGRSKAA